MGEMIMTQVRVEGEREGEINKGEVIKASVCPTRRQRTFHTEPPPFHNQHFANLKRQISNQQEDSQKKNDRIFVEFSFKGEGGHPPKTKIVLLFKTFP